MLMHIKNWLKISSKGAFLLLLLVNLIPSFALVFTEPFNIWGKILLIIFPAGLFTLIFSLLRNVGKMQLILIPLLVIHAFQIVVFYLFGEGVIAVDMFLNVLTTNVSEAGEVLDAVWEAVVFVIVVYVPTIVLSFIVCRRKLNNTVRFRKKALFAGFGLLALSFVLSLKAKDVNTEDFIFYEEVYPINVFNNLRLASQKWSLRSEYLVASKDFTYQAVRNDTLSAREIVVLVIGETSRADNWSLYGYNRDTNPLLRKQEDLVVFQDAVTQSNATHKSVSIMLTAASAEDYSAVYQHKSILTAFKEVGFKTIFLSNQSANRTFTDYYAQEADYTRYYRFFNKKINHFDGDMLPEFQHLVDSIPGNLFVVLHTYGSHFNYKERYPDAYSVFKPDDVAKIKKEHRPSMINAYDNTVLYTDFILDQVISILKSTGACASMLYASDHGEDLLDDKRNRFLHASPTPTYYQLRIPLLLWFSDNYKELYADVVANTEANRRTPISTNTLFHTLLDLAHIETPYFDASRSLVNKGLEDTVRMYLSDHDRPVPFYKSGIKKEDKWMIEKKQIAY